MVVSIRQSSQLVVNRMQTAVTGVKVTQASTKTFSLRHFMVLMVQYHTASTFASDKPHGHMRSFSENRKHGSFKAFEQTTSAVIFLVRTSVQI